MKIRKFFAAIAATVLMFGWPVAATHHDVNQPVWVDDARPTSTTPMDSMNIPAPAQPLGGWMPVDAELAAILRVDGQAPDFMTRDWMKCVQHIDDTTVIACPDGYTEVS